MVRRKNIRNAYDSLNPSQMQKEKMLASLLSAASQDAPGRKEAQMKHTRKKLVLIAAAAAILALLVGCAAVIFRMQDMQIGEYTPDNAANETQAVRSVLTLQGFVGSRNYLANKEWFDFSSNYEIPLEEELPMEERLDYLAYGAFFQEQIDKIDEICQKYNLTTLGHEWMETDVQTTFDALGIDGILTDQANAEVTLNPGYYYSNGTFMMDGRLSLLDDALNWPHEISFSMRCSMKESLDTVCVHIRNIDSYRQWNYTMADGTQLLIVLNQQHGMMFADFEDFFVTINVHTSLSEHQPAMNPAVMEAIAQVFDLSFRPQRVDEEAAQQRQEKMLADLQEEQKQNQEYHDKRIGKESYDARVRVLLENTNIPERSVYAFVDLDCDGNDELLLGHDDKFGAIYTYKDGETHSFVPTDGTSLFHLCEDNVIASISHTDEDIPMQKTYWFVKLQGTRSLCLDSVLYIPWEEAGKQWVRNQAVTPDGTVLETFDPYDHSLGRLQTPITKEEAQTIIAKYRPIQCKTTPLLEYPLP